MRPPGRARIRPDSAGARAVDEAAPLYAYTGGFLLNPRIRRILELAGHPVRVGLPPRGGQVAVWGATGRAWRGRLIARLRGARVVTVEDAFLRSVLPGRGGEGPQGLVIDREGPCFDASRPSELERLLSDIDLRAAGLGDRAARAREKLAHWQLSKYNAFDPLAPLPEPGFVLVIDQTRGDAAIRLGGADDASFRRMLDAARAENPGRPILIRTHPETVSGGRRGHFSAADCDSRTRLVTAAHPPRALLERAERVYTVTSLMGFEAILAGHRPRVFGQPFYAGWGLSDDETPLPRRSRRLTVDELFAGTMLLYPVWYDVHRDRLCDLETVIDNLAAQARAHAEDRAGWQAVGISRWKRRHFRRFFAAGPLRFAETPRPDGPPVLAWASRLKPARAQALEGTGQRVVRVEDGFLRSTGLGAELVPPLSLVLDDLGIYYDPARESRLERILNAAPGLPAAELERAEALRRRLVAAGVTKYNLKGALPESLPEGRRILVPGQVEDDASVLLGGRGMGNLALLQRARAENPGAVILYKPHPDVEAGLRKGRVPPERLAGLADAVLDGVGAAAALDAADAVFTLTSGLGFEALLRGLPVTCFGVPFYAGWGLTRDRGPVPPRRRARLTLAQLVHGVLIAYPRYHDPVTDLPCPVEVAIERLEQGRGWPRSRRLRLVAALQGAAAPLAPLWRLGR